MKISLFLNNYLPLYNKPHKAELVSLDKKILSDVINSEDQFILRGEPTIYPDLHNVLNQFKRKKNYILTTHMLDLDALLSYDRTIPYVSVFWDGILNDKIKGTKPLTANMIRFFDSIKGKDTTTRIHYTFTSTNAPYFMSDITTLKGLITNYQKMKQPYFSLHQSGFYYSESEFVWPPFTRSHLTELNKQGLLTKKNFNYLLGFLSKDKPRCVSPQNEITILYDGTVRLCQSHRIVESLGSLYEKSLQEILEENKENIKSAETCPLREQCWFSHHFHDNHEV